MKKKCFAAAILIASVMINAQTGLVGVNTSTPTNTLDVNGTARVRSLLPNTFNSSVDKIVVADANGALKSVPASAISSSSYEVLFDLTPITDVGISDSNPNGDDARTAVTIQNQTINLTKDALVQINFAVPIWDVFKYGTSAAPTDGGSKMLRTHLVVDNVIVVKSTNTYTNTSVGTGTGTSAEALKGVFFNTGSAFVKLTAGTHTIRLEGTCNPYITCRQGGGGQGTKFQAVALY